MATRKPRTIPLGIFSNLSRNAPSLTDALIIVFISAALVLFLFWLATVLGNVPILETLPDFITGSFKSVWASATSATAGIGLAIYRALTSNRQERPHYLVWILITSAVFVAIIYGLTQWLHKQGFKKIELPSDLHSLSTNKETKRPTVSSIQSFYLVSYPIFGVRYKIEGIYSIQGNQITGKVVQGYAELNPTSAPMDPSAGRLTLVSVNLCHVQIFVNKEGMQITPSPNNTNNSVDTDLKLIPGVRKNLPEFNFRINLPEGKISNKIWLCGQVFNMYGGSFTSYQTDKFLNTKSSFSSGPPVAKNWGTSSPIVGDPISVPCPCVAIRYGESPKAPNIKLGEDAFIDVKNDCAGAVTAVAYKLMAPNVPQADLFKSDSSTQYSETKLKPDESIRYSLVESYGGGGFLTSCNK